MFRAAVVALPLTLFALTAAAHDDGHQWVRRPYKECDAIGFCEVKYRYLRLRSHQPPQYREIEFRVPTRHDVRGQCAATVEALSTEHQDEINARNAATKLWMAQVQWKYGGAMMDMENAADVLWRCSASNAHDTISGKLAEGVAKLTGRDGQNVRCQVWARPCMGRKEPEAPRNRR